MSAPAVEIAREVTPQDVPRPRLSQSELEHLYARSDRRPAVYVAVAVTAAIGTMLVACAWPHPLILVAAAVLIGTLQHHFSIIHHESVHYLLFRSRRLNDVVGSIIAFATGFSMAYRTHHLAHHRRLGQDDDPDLDAYADYPTNRLGLVVDLARHLCGAAAIEQFLRQMQRARALSKAGGGTSGAQILGIVATQMILFALFALAGHPWLYFVLWLLPLLTVAKTLAHFRSVVEHTVAVCCDGKPTRYRTIVCGPIEGFFFAPMNFNLHAEHHFYPAIPYYNLPQAFRILSQDPTYHDVVRLDHGYLAYLLRDAVGTG